ncbi:uncharacterized protein LOC123307582 [Coccinella septempunctata]|uniref:uncharacterized protein LOC123307582 n=1 Tax=Coccinella septempunctata TaxID=41139 RepID=UPI001D0642BD|nr:uncharacterized protein LOC123307582 [Coccinella septempunctata]XP_044745884.1 uncharacterized protein LOC123307582 [Coccinella septempunctata]
MQKCVQLHKESINMYFHEKISLCKQLDLDFNETKEQVIIGLISKDLSQFLMSQHHYDEDDLLRDITNYNRIVNARIEKARENRTRFESKEKNRSDVTMKPKTEADIKPKVMTSQVKCYNCSEMGHFSYNCSKPKREMKCLRCNEVGHTPKHCTKPRILERPEIKILGSVRPSDKYIKHVKVGDEEYIAMIDCGSSDCTIRATAAIKGKFRIILQDCELKGFGSESQSIVKSCGVIMERVEVDGVQADNVKFRVVPDDVQPIDIIIGRNFTELNHIVYYKVDDNFNFAYKDHLQNIFLNQEPNQTKEIKFTENITLPERSINFISARVENDNYILPIMNKSNVEEKVNGEKKVLEKIMKIDSVEPIATRRKEEINMDEIVVGPEVTQVIAKNIHEIGKTNLIEMDIKEKLDSRPVTCKPYKTTQEEREETKQIVGEWKEAGIVTETISPYASPVLLVKKKTEDGLMRMLTEENERYKPPQVIQEEIQGKIRSEQNKTKDRYVYMKANPVSTGESTNLQRRFKGPLVIGQVLQSDTYGLTNLDENQDEGNLEDEREEETQNEDSEANQNEDPEANQNEDPEVNKNEDPEVNQNEDPEANQVEPNNDVHEGRAARRRRLPRYLQDYIM